MASRFSRFFSRTRKRLEDDHGHVAVDLAFLCLFLGLVLVSIAYFFDVVTVRNKTSSAADAVANAAAMDSSITNAEIAAIFKAAEVLMEPLANVASVKLTSIVPTPDRTGRVVAWSEATGTSADIVGAAFAFPAEADSSFGAEADKSVLVATVTVNYTSAIADILRSIPFSGNFVSAQHNFTEQSFALPVGIGERRWTSRVP